MGNMNSGRCGFSRLASPYARKVNKPCKTSGAFQNPPGVSKHAGLFLDAAFRVSQGARDCQAGHKSLSRCHSRAVADGSTELMSRLTRLPLAAPWPERPASGVWLMGIVNVTPDSFSDGGRFDETQAAVSQAKRLTDEGADLIDIGGESTRPSAEPVPVAEEIARIEPVLARLKADGFARAISIDTYKAETADVALSLGATIVNDVWGLQRDSVMADVVARHGAGLVIMHNRESKDETLDIVADMERFFAISLERAAKAGIRQDRIVLDPGIGFGKTFEQNLAAIRAIPRLKALGYPVLLGLSRKSFLGLITDREVGDRLAATLAADVLGLVLGADILRVHDVAPHRDAIRVAASLSPLFDTSLS